MLTTRNFYFIRLHLFSFSLCQWYTFISPTLKEICEHLSSNRIFKNLKPIILGVLIIISTVTQHFETLVKHFTILFNSQKHSMM